MRCIDGLDRIDDDEIVLVCLSGGEDVFEVVGLVDVETLGCCFTSIHPLFKGVVVVLIESVFSVGDLASVFFSGEVGDLDVVVGT